MVYCFLEIQYTHVILFEEKIILYGEKDAQFFSL